MAKATTMTIADVQKRLDAMPAAMSAKGMKSPRADFTIRANEPPQGHIAWPKKGRFTGDEYKFFSADTAAEILDAMAIFIAALPAPEETRMKEFMSALSDVIELGRTNGIDVEFINPLTEAMKRLSSNILTDQRAA